jgi:hypothetical protein
MRAIERLSGVPQCAGVFCGEQKSPSLECQVSLKKPSGGWKAKVTLKMRGRGNIIDVNDSSLIDVDEQDGTLEIINPKDSRNKFWGEMSKDKTQMQFSNYFNGGKVWELRLIKREDL